uniref:Amidinotransferase n=1 Tax=Steinernema glaseri TaxID=37863 RepID=A0A1I7Z8G7_9BILA
MAKALEKVLPHVQRIMMCRPTHFDSTLEDCGAQVDVLEPHGADHYPDMVFAANAAVVYGKKAYLANFYYPERKGERFFYKKWLEENGFQTFGSLEIPFEGAGDALFAGNNLFCGVGPRSDVRALRDLAEKLVDPENPFSVVGCRLVDPRFYHIDTCFCPVSEDIAIWFPQAFDAISQHNMTQHKVELIPVPEADAANFACNAVSVGNTVVMHRGNEATAKLLEANGLNVRFVDMSEFIKAGGSAKCCTLKLG